MTMDVSTPELKGPQAIFTLVLLALTAFTAVLAAILGSVSGHWFTLGFEVAVLLTASLGMFVAMGRPAYGQPLALVCVAGVIAVASFLESVGVDRSFLGPLGRRLGTIRAPAVTIHVDALLLFRLAAAALLAGQAGWLLMRRDPRPSRRRFAIGLALACAALCVLAAAWAGRAAIFGLAGPVKWGVAVVGFLLVTGLVAGAVQHLVHAFSAGRIRSTDR